MIVRFVFCVAAIVLVITSARAQAPADPSSVAWTALVKGGHVALIRHGNAPPGRGGDPPGMRIDDCATQRNLDDAGREQAKALGEAFRARGVRVDRVQSSPMCRCLDTARLMAVGTVEASRSLLPDMNRNEPTRLRELKDAVTSWRGPGTLVLVTHGLTIQPLVGIIPEQAEVVVLAPTSDAASGFRVVGRIPPPR